MNPLRAIQSLAATALLLCAGPAAAQQPGPLRLPEPLRQPATDSIHVLAGGAMTRLGVPGMSVAVVEDGRIVFLRGWGMANVENLVLAKPATAYRTASLAKPVTAAAVMQLVEGGDIALDASIRTYVPALPATYDGVNIRDLLRHTGGVRHYANGEFITTRNCARLEDALDIFAADPLDHAPGEKITYSSYGYTLLGLAIEAVTGATFGDHVRRHVFEPAGMRATHVDDDGIIPNRAAGYERTADGELRNAALLDTSCRIPAGGFVSTVEDLARFAIALEAGVLMKEASVREMMRSHLTRDIIDRTLAGIQLPPGYVPPGMGFGWAVSPADDAVYHGGNQPGATAMLYHVPVDGVSVVVMTNLAGIGDALTELAQQIAELSARN